MATFCPNCDGRLRIYNVGPNCPHCEVNLLYYDIENRLLADADAAEAESAQYSKKFSRAKAALVGSPLAIARIVLSLLPIGALFLTLVKGTIEAPFVSETINASIIRIFTLIAGTDFDSLFTFVNSDLMGSAFIPYLISLIAVGVIVLGSFINLFALLFACSPHGKLRSILIPSLNLMAAIVGMVAFSRFNTLMEKMFPSVFNASFGIGAYLTVALLAALLILNIVIVKVGIPVKYKEKFVGEIPAERYFQAIEAGEDIAALREQIAKENAEKEKEESEKENDEDSQIEKAEENQHAKA
ncbi:MAG TPA: hypothetical protein VFD52_00230 [Clostridia bacterium]|nr:hypothetical protein [Clostridia bacterium]